jgi:hypothetical protein
VAVIAAFGVSACQGALPLATPMTSTTPTESATPSMSASPTPPPLDPAVTTDVCNLAAAATASTTHLFNDQIAALEQAAARNDQAAMVAAAAAINKQFLSLAATLTQLAERPVTPALKTVLTDVATALTQMSALAYTGTTVDIRKKLLDFAAAFAKTCVPGASASPAS